MRLLDDDSDDPSSTSDDIIDEIGILYTDSLEVSTQFTSLPRVDGIYGYVTLEQMEIRVTCASGWTGNACDQCIPAAGCCKYVHVYAKECMLHAGYNFYEQTKIHQALQL